MFRSCMRRGTLLEGKVGTLYIFRDLFLHRKRGRKQEKGGKGLRHFSMKVCEKVQKKVVTSYNEVADELVMEFSDPRNITPTDQVSVDNWPPACQVLILINLLGYWESLVNKII